MLPLAVLADGDLVKPNVIFFLADDHQAGLVGAMGHEQIQTPHLDQLSERGMTFTNAHAEIASCSPSRASILSGCSGFTHKAMYPRFSSEFNAKLLPDVWPRAMKKNGYKTFWIGKWNTQGWPKAFGIDSTSSIFYGGMGSHDVKIKERDGSISKGFSSTVFADAAIRFLDEKQDQPFFMTVAFTAPHDPRTPPKEFVELYQKTEIELPQNFMEEHPFDNGYLDIRDEKLLTSPRDKDAVKKDIAAYYGMVSQMDQQIGRVLQKLKDRKLDENTIVIFAGDHGLAMGQHGLLGKFSMYDHSTKTPLIIAGPGIKPNQTSESLVYLHDIYPTVCSLTDAQIGSSVEGISFAPALHMQEFEMERDMIYCAHSKYQRMARDKRYKLVRYYRSEKDKKGEDRYQLFDLRRDSHELNDLIQSPEHQVIIKKLKSKLRAWQKERGDFLL